MSSTVTAREADALNAAQTLLTIEEGAAVQAALLLLPLSASDASFVEMTLSEGRMGMRAMMLGKAAVSLIEFKDAAVGLGIVRALEAFWIGPGQTDDRYRPLARVEIGSVMTMQSRAMVRLGQTDRALALVGQHAALHDRDRYVRIRVAEGLARAHRIDEARALMPQERPDSDIAEQSAWDVVRGLIDQVDDDADGMDDEDLPGGSAVAIAQQWHRAIDKTTEAIREVAKAAGMPELIVDAMVSRLQAERESVPANEAELAKRLNGLREAIRGGLGQ